MSPIPASIAAVTLAGGSVFVTAMMRTPAGSRPAARAATATARRTSATRAANPSRVASSGGSSGKQTGSRECPPDLVQRQPDHVRERPVDGGDEPGALPLDGVGPRLVVGLAAGDVAGNRGRAQRPEAHAGRHHVLGNTPAA